MTVGAFGNDRCVKRSVVQNATDITIIDWLVDINLYFGVNVNRLRGDAFMLQDTDAGVKGDARKNNTSSRDVASINLM